MKILFVDDEPDFLEQAKIFLEKEDSRLDIDTVPSAKDALEFKITPGENGGEIQLQIWKAENFQCLHGGFASTAGDVDVYPEQ